MGWKSADSAPKDGTVFWGRNDRLGEPSEPRKMRWGVAARPDENYMCNDGNPWWINEDGRYLAPAPTEWMPIESNEGD